MEQKLNLDGAKVTIINNKHNLNPITENSIVIIKYPTILTPVKKEEKKKELEEQFGCKVILLTIETFVGITDKQIGITPTMEMKPLDVIVTEREEFYDWQGKCPNCNTYQLKGNFCSNCGAPLNFIIKSKEETKE